MSPWRRYLSVICSYCCSVSEQQYERLFVLPRVTTGHSTGETVGVSVADKKIVRRASERCAVAHSRHCCAARAEKVNDISSELGDAPPWLPGAVNLRERMSSSRSAFGRKKKRARFPSPFLYLPQAGIHAPHRSAIRSLIQSRISSSTQNALA